MVIAPLLLPLFAENKEVELPANAKILLQKLTAFEEEERRKYELAVSEKREQVAELLDRYLEDETKAGNLDGAMAIKARVEQLRDPDAAAPGEPESKNEPGSQPREDWYLDRTWAIEGSPQAYTFKAGGVAWKNVNGQTTHINFEWKLMESGALEIRGENKPIYFWLDSSRRGEGTAVSERIDGLKLERRN